MEEENKVSEIINSGDRNIKSRTIEITGLIGFLHEIIEDGSKVPFSKKTLVDTKDIITVLEEIETALPGDLRTAEWVLNEKDRILQEAKDEYDRAKKEAEELMIVKVNNHDIVKEAEIKAQEIISKAQTESKMVRLSARDYADNLISDLESEIEHKNEEMLEKFKKLFEDFVKDYDETFIKNQTTIKSNIKELREM